MKHLGKITNAEFGLQRDYPFMFGLQLEFSFDGSCVGDGGMYTINIYSGCKWDSAEQKAEAVEKCIIDTVDVLKDAKVNNVSQLKDKPVEVELDGNLFKSFRILTEVL